MVVQAGWNNTKAAMQELCDRGLDAEVRANVRAQARRADVGGEVEIQAVQGVKAGQNYLVDVEVAAPRTWSLERLQKVEDAVRERVGAKVRGVRRVRVRFVPLEAAAADFGREFIAADVSPRSSPEPDDHQHHDHGEASGNAQNQGKAVRER